MEVVTRDAKKADEWRHRGARAAIVDVRDVGALRRVFKGGRRLFLLNPPAPPSTDTAREERENLRSILSALDGSGLEKIVAQSTYGAQPGDRLGDLGVLYEMEQALASQPIPSSIVRGAYYMSNWDASLDTVLSRQELFTFFPPEYALPMVAPSDLGHIAARLMMAPAGSTEIVHAEGPERYSSRDVAAAFGAALKTTVKTVMIPPERRESALRGLGFSEQAAASFSAMTDAAIRTAFPSPQAVTRGPTTLRSYIEQCVLERGRAQ